ncbi:Phosphopantetheine attachment site [Streptomyces sp. Ncost-T6T-1]|uniref:acyl carrier protein n=1 Tax=Streptomyces sp. Ncost-T6T-1 TaxID=1100828 RepID=UPI0008049972|nr:acyl carrier protein [Streptomyces sp. Ncost-T6T-1]SBV04578.1 Phosphopantetheine attachment site [Streptomyces sp. Ncost-T6T-1]
MQVSAASDEAAGQNRRPDIERSVIEWLRAELEDPHIVGSDNFLDIGGHSLTFAKLNEHLGNTFGVSLDNKITYSQQLSTAVAQARPAEQG